MSAQVLELQQELAKAQKAVQDGARWFRGEPPNFEAQRLQERLAQMEGELAGHLAKEQEESAALRIQVSRLQDEKKKLEEAGAEVELT